MRGGMAGLAVDDKENTPVPGEGKKRRSGGTGSARRLSISGSKSHAHYLRAIVKRFKRKGGAGRGRILVHRPLRFDGSPFEFDSRSDGDKRRSIVVFEDDLSFKPKEFAIELETTGKVSPTARSKNGKCRTLKPGAAGEQTASRESVQQKSKYHALESIVVFRDRAKAMFAAKLRPSPVAPLVEAANQQESDSRTPLEIQARKWRRGGGGRVYTQCSLDTSELEDIEQVFRKMDEEDLEEQLHRHELEREMDKYDLTKEMQEKDHREHDELFVSAEVREHEELFVSAEVSETHETVKIQVQEQANVCELAPETLNSQDWRLLSPRIGGLEIEGEIANVELTTPQLRLNQEEPVPKPTPVILELGVSSESSDAYRGIEQLTPPGRLPFSGCNNQDLDTLQQIPGQVKSQLAQTLNDVQVWSVELDPSRRRREIMEDYRNWRSPWLERLAHSSFRAAYQVPGSARKPAQLNVSMPSSSLNTSQLDTDGPAKNLVEAYEGEFRSTNLPSSSGKDQSGKEEDEEIIDGGFINCSGRATINEDEMHNALIENEREMHTWRDSKATLRSSWSSLPDQSPVRPTDVSAQCGGSSYEKPSESSLESPSLQATELLRRIESVTATTPLVQASFDTIGMSPTPPRDICLYLGNPFGKMSGEELSRRWLQFCASPSVFSDVIAKNKKSWKVESTFTEPTCLDPTTSSASEQVLQRTIDDVLPNTEEEAVSSDELDWKTSTHDEDVLPNAGEEALSSDDLDWKTSTHDEDVLPNAGEEALSSDGSDGVMDYENDYDDISNDTTQIIQTGASCAYNDQEGTSALKEYPQEDVPLGEDVPSLNLTPLRDNNPVAAIIDPAVEFSLTHLEEEHIDQFMSSLQVTPVLDESCVEMLTINGEDISKVSYNGHSPAGKAGHLSVMKELITPGKDENKSLPQTQDENKSLPQAQDENKSLPQAQDECTPVQNQTKTKRSRKSTKTKKVDSPLDAGSKWSNGKRQSTRIRSKPLDWWRGERMLYGRVHSTLNTLIGIKHLSPDPVWPRPRRGDRRNKVAPQKFKVDSFVSDEHNELLRLAAQ